VLFPIIRLETSKVDWSPYVY